MSLPLSEINWLAVLAGGVISLVVGFAWYAPPLFGNTWMRLSGISQEQVRQGPGLGFLWTFIAALVAATALALLVIMTDGGSFVEGALAGGLAAVGFVATGMFTNVIFEKKHVGAWAINAGYQVVWLALAGGVLAIWR